MINRSKRNLAAGLLRKFVATEITNDDFVNEYPRADRDDVAIGAIYEGLWGFWDDLDKDDLTKERNYDKATSALFERCIEFLYSDLEYEWPRIQRVSFVQAVMR